MAQSPDFSLAGRVALITGAGRGIGLSIAHALVSAGCAVAIQDLDLEVAQAECRKITESGGRALALGGDIGDFAAVRELVPRTVEALGGLHILVNNAAIQIEKPWLEAGPDEIEKQWRANLIAPIVLCQQAVPIFRAQGFGRILNVGSIQGKSGYTGMLAYSMSKAALGNFNTALAREVGKDQITVNLIAPGYFATWRNREHFKTPEDRRKAPEWIPLRRIGVPEDAGGIALLLCSAAGSYITGQTIYVDGGMSAR
ncbi:MAG: SDR family NAD(P)-dependent oxidoreductase [Planctomycetota bacterium]|nr:SDR family NAD(P)-dependent oxidoreductase [Planctomycetota bacterium]